MIYHEVGDFGGSNMEKWYVRMSKELCNFKKGIKCISGINDMERCEEAYCPYHASGENSKTL